MSKENIENIIPVADPKPAKPKEVSKRKADKKPAKKKLNLTNVPTTVAMKIISKR